MGIAEAFAPYTQDDTILEVDGMSLAALDSNRRVLAERESLRVAAENPFLDEDEIIRIAISIAEENLATAKQAAEGIAQLRHGGAYCYLAFYGMGGVAQFVKIGMTRHPEQRVHTLTQGVPLDCLWVFTSKLPTVRAAFHAEQTMLRHMEPHRRRGEWFEVGSTDEGGALSMARTLGELAMSVEPGASEFVPDGH